MTLNFFTHRVERIQLLRRLVDHLFKCLGQAPRICKAPPLYSIFYDVLLKAKSILVSRRMSPVLGGVSTNQFLLEQRFLIKFDSDNFVIPGVN